MLKVVILIKEGKEIEEIVLIINKYKDNFLFFGIFEILENVIKGGRINLIVGKIINILNFKVII